MFDADGETWSNTFSHYYSLYPVDTTTFIAAARMLSYLLVVQSHGFEPRHTLLSGSLFAK
jgi:hypothetical protein